MQPQWVLDSANFRVLADAELYTPGKHPPPHLSPFVTYDDEGYVPDYAKAMLKLQVNLLTPCMSVSSFFSAPPIMPSVGSTATYLTSSRPYQRSRY